MTSSSKTPPFNLRLLLILLTAMAVSMVSPLAAPEPSSMPSSRRQVIQTTVVSGAGVLAVGGGATSSPAAAAAAGPNSLKTKDVDDNFAIWTAPTPATGKSGRKRHAEEAGSSSKANGKRPANGVSGEIPGKEGVGPGECSDTFFKGFHDEEHAISYGKLTCKENEVFSVLKCSSGKWLLLKSIEE